MKWKKLVYITYSHENDFCRYHLQAFRHLYVLAAELRTMLPRDVDTGFPCYVPIEIRFRVSSRSPTCNRHRLQFCKTDSTINISHIKLFVILEDEKFKTCSPLGKCFFV